MFMCKQCLEQFEDSHLAYELILEIRLSSPVPDYWVLKFCSLQHVQDFLRTVVHNQQQRYVLTKKGQGGDKRFEPAFPSELLLLVGSSKGF
ncbi:MAG: hypothetical protein ACM3XM_00460 [Mycobacterium leprae]